MSKEKIKKIIKLCQDYESDIDIDKAVSENDEYRIGKWDLCQEIREIVGFMQIDKKNNRKETKWS